MKKEKRFELLSLQLFKNRTVFKNRTAKMRGVPDLQDETRKSEDTQRDEDNSPRLPQKGRRNG